MEKSEAITELTKLLIKQDIKDKLGISFTRFYEAIMLLRRMHYICCSGSNQFHFFLSPNPDYEKEHGLQDWVFPESVQLNPKTEKDLPKIEIIVPERNIEIDNIDKINNKDIGRSKQTLAINLDHVLFNGLASAEDLRAIQKWIDVDAYHRVDRKLLKDNWGNDEKYRSCVLLYLSQLLDEMKDADVNALENLINQIVKEASANE